MTQIRTEVDGDAEALRELHLRAFGDHGRTVATLVDDLRRIEGCLSLVASEDGRPVGHVMFTRSLLDAPPRLVDVQVLSPLAVLPSWQGQGIGGALVKHGLQILSGGPAPLVFLEGSPAYYGRFGFAAGGELGFRKPSLRIPDAAFQVYRLPAYEPWMTGTLVYAHEFWDHDSVGLR